MAQAENPPKRKIRMEMLSVDMVHEHREGVLRTLPMPARRAACSTVS